MSTEVFDKAKRVYQAATDAYWAQRECGGIVKFKPETDEEWDDYRAGVRFRAVTDAGKMVMSVWQKARAELQWAQDDIRRRAGDDSCPVCDRPERVDRNREPPRLTPEQQGGVKGLIGALAKSKAYEPDPRLPPERDDDEEAPF